MATVVSSSAATISNNNSTHPARKQKVLTQPINQIFRLLQQKSRVQLMLYENNHSRIEGVIIGFDEYMNLVLDNASELDIKHNTEKSLGRILLKGDNITLIMTAPIANNKTNTNKTTVTVPAAK